MHRITLLFTFSFLGAIASMSACSEIKHAYDCGQICNRYKDCFDNDYDVDSCVSKCRNHADDDNDYGEQAEDCQNCIEDRSCAGATFACATECTGIVP